ncbi:DNA-processing protein DprA [Oscillospiraceae bacterium CM]|nr:DNA-processing protein DprA [Oscillospiraceae bacterium CM]
MASLKYWVWLSSRPGMGPLTALRVLNWFASPEQVFFAPEQAYRDVGGLTPRDIEALSDKNLSSAAKTLEACAENGYRIITLGDGDYPARLLNIADPPLVLYVRGRLPVMDEEAAIAVVGTRKCTPYGVKEAERLGYELTRCGCLVVTGLARGIDTTVALGALRAGGRVVGVLGSGLDIVYPPENRQLFEDVAAVGAILSEYPPQTPAAGEHFPRRNRIMSGLCVAVAVVEAPKKSGALITANFALEQGRDVYALPGNVDAPACAGSNQLLREGAVLVTSGREIAEEYMALFPEKICLDREKVPLDKKRADNLARGAADTNRRISAKKEIDNAKTVEYIDLVKLKERLNDAEYAVVTAIGSETRHIDEIIAACALRAGDVLSLLTLLELDGVVEQSSGKYFKLCDRINAE